jgi:hypothetical protein
VRRFALLVLVACCAGLFGCQTSHRYAPKKVVRRMTPEEKAELEEKNQREQERGKQNEKQFREESWGFVTGKYPERMPYNDRPTEPAR